MTTFGNYLHVEYDGVHRTSTDERLDAVIPKVLFAFENNADITTACIWTVVNNRSIKEVLWSCERYKDRILSFNHGISHEYFAQFPRSQIQEVEL